jgi:hypothetical protein
VEQSGVYIKCRDNFQMAKVSLHAGRDGRPGRWRMGFEDYVAKKYPGLIPAGRDRAWEVWDEPSQQLPKSVIAFKLCFPDLELAVRPDQRKTKDAAEDQDSSQDRNQIPSRQGGEGRSW